MRMKIAQVQDDTDVKMDSEDVKMDAPNEGVEYVVEFLRQEGDQADFLEAYNQVKESVLSFAIERID